jgi:WD40 repeat protein
VFAIYENNIHNYDTKFGGWIYPATNLSNNSPQIGCICYSPCSKQLACGTNDGDIYIYDISNINVWNLVTIIKNDILAVTSLCYSPCGHILICGDGSSGVKIWNVRTGHLMEKLVPAMYYDYMTEHNYSTYNIMYSPDCKHLAYVYADHIYVRDVCSGKLIHLLAAPNIKCFDYTGDSRYIISGHASGKIIKHDLKTRNATVIHIGPDSVLHIQVKQDDNYGRAIMLNNYRGISP